jgi:hypothetical protein
LPPSSRDSRFRLAGSVRLRDRSGRRQNAGTDFAELDEVTGDRYAAPFYTLSTVQQIGSHFSFKGLNLSETAIHEQFRTRDVTAVGGREKYHGFGDLVGSTEPA